MASPSLPRWSCFAAIGCLGGYFYFHFFPFITCTWNCKHSFPPAERLSLSVWSAPSLCCSDCRRSTPSPGELLSHAQPATLSGQPACSPFPPTAADSLFVSSFFFLESCFPLLLATDIFDYGDISWNCFCHVWLLVIVKSAVAIEKTTPTEVSRPQPNLFIKLHAHTWLLISTAA